MMKYDKVKVIPYTIICLITALLGGVHSGYGQVGGRQGFGALHIPTTAKTAALGGVAVTSLDEDVNMFLSNPALLSENTHLHASLNYQAYLADMSYSSLAYAHHWEKTGTWGFGLQYMNYGEFVGYDASGNEAADFKARDYAITVGYVHEVGLFSFGGNVKLAQSVIDSYAATAVLLDIGGIYKHPEKALIVGLLIKNLGIIAHDYRQDSDIRLPLDVQVGTSFKPEHMPVRFTFTLYNLAKDNVAYYDPDWNNNQDAPGFVDKMFRHMAIGAEILLSKNVNLRAGYNHMIRKELKLDETSGMAGFSLGFLVKVKAFELAYTKRFYHVAGGTHSFTITSDLSGIIKSR